MDLLPVHPTEAGLRSRMQSKIFLYVLQVKSITLQSLRILNMEFILLMFLILDTESRVQLYLFIQRDCFRNFYCYNLRWIQI
jgi:hypothetical protein